VNYVLVTGAGAACNFGRDGVELPLMSRWAELLCDKLDESEERLAENLGLRRDMLGPEFEEALGAFLRWDEFRVLDERFKGLGGNVPGEIFGNVPEARANAAARAARIMEIINHSLYDEFGARRIDGAAASDAYTTLFELMGGKPLAVVTTNYDHSIEMAFEQMEYRADTGFQSEATGFAPVLRPLGLVERIADNDRAIPVLHLHGAVGWYEEDGEVVDHYKDRPFNPTLGKPAVLYPDPRKDPTRDAMVQALWDEFRGAMVKAFNVLVIGHSLNDPALVEALNDASEHCEVAVCIHLGAETTTEDAERKTNGVMERIPNVTVLPAEFGPKPDLPDQLESWRRVAE
jgi:SIR2-like domain